ncbi:hypothetical protein [Vibrio fortis]
MCNFCGRTKTRTVHNQYSFSSHTNLPYFAKSTTQTNYPMSNAC